jgi:hypothetical protein
MAENTGQLDKLIEDKVNQKIREFSSKITSQIKDFLQENGDYSGDYLYQADGFELYNSEFRVREFRHMKLYTMNRALIGGLELTIKDRMITRETKDLLAKVALLS